MNNPLLYIETNMNKTPKKQNKRDKMTFDAFSEDYLMTSNNCFVGLNMPPALSGDSTFNLPPYRRRTSYLVDKYPNCPKNWLLSEGKSKSYFVPVIKGNGMWLDFNKNNQNDHHMAIVISIQGINPITGLPCSDPHLEQYIENCPKHKTKFGPDRYCKKCNFKWPKQNYICTTGTPSGQLWLDGFRAADGIVRQYILTADKMKGVASNIIGEDRVYAIGISFFLSKEKKPVSTYISTQTYIPYYPYYYNPFYYTNPYYYTDGPMPNPFLKTTNYPPTTGEYIYMSQNVSASSINTSCAYSCSNDMSVSNASNILRSNGLIQTKKLEVAAGAKISQLVYDDPEKLDYWHSDPESIICINYCLEKDAQKIIEGGVIDIEGNKEGFLQDMPIGN